MIDKIKTLLKNEKVKKIIDKIRNIPPKYGYIVLAVLSLIVCIISIIAAVTKHDLEQIATEVLPQSLITFTEDNNIAYITDDLQLMQEFTHNDKTYVIDWKSDNTKVISNEGVVTRPHDKNKEVVLTASIKKGITSIEFEYELTVICDNIINATEMQSLTAESIMTDNVLTGVKFDKNSLVLNTDVDAALFAEYYINKLNNSTIRVIFCQTTSSLTGQVFMFKQANQGVPIQDTFVNVFVNEKGNPIEISLHLETEAITNDTELITESDVISAFINLRDIDTKNIYSITEEYVNAEKLYKIVYNSNNEMYALFLTNEETQTNKDKNANLTLAKTNKNTIYQSEIQKYNAIQPNFNRGINIYTDADIGTELYTEISKNMQTIYDWFLRNCNMWSFNNCGSDIDILLDSQIGTNITRYNNQLQLFYFNHTDGHTRHMGACLDIVTHEYSHAIFDSIVGDIDKPTAEIPVIKEAYADVFACLVDDDWIVGEGLIDDNKDLRNLENNTNQYQDEYWSDSETYDNSIVLSRTAYLMSEKGIDNNDIVKIWYQSMFYGYHNESTLKDVKKNLIQAATALDYNTKTIEIINECFQEIGI